MTDAGAWMPLYIGDYLGDTGDLTAEQHGCYLLMLMHCWRMGRLSNDSRQLAALCRMSPVLFERRIRPTLIGYFEQNGDELRHKRVDQEREKAGLRIQALRAKGSKGGKKKHENSYINSGHSPYIKSEEIEQAKQNENNDVGLAEAKAEAEPRVVPSPSHLSSNEDKIQSPSDSAAGAAGPGLRGEILPPERPLRPLPGSTPGPTPQVVDFPNQMPIRDRLWREGRPIVRMITGITEHQAGGLIGKLVKIAQEDCALVWEKLVEAENLRPVEPRAWLMAACNRRNAHNTDAAMLDAAGLLNAHGNLIPELRRKAQ